MRLKAEDSAPEGEPSMGAGMPTPSSPRLSARVERERLSFLAEASDVLASSLDLETTLESVARLAVPRLADGCLIDLLDDAGRLTRAAVVHAEPDAGAALRELGRKARPVRGRPSAGVQTLQTGRAELVTVTPDREHPPDVQALLDRVRPQSEIVAPLLDRSGAAFGVLSLITGPGRRALGPGDVPLAVDLAHRAALAIENARLYGLVQAERDRLRQVLDALPEAVILTDARGNSVLMNQATETVLGTRPTSLQASWEALHPRRPDGRLLDADELPIARVIATGQELRGEHLLIRHLTSGRKVEILVNTAPLRGVNRRISGAVSIFQDVTELQGLNRQKDAFIAAVSHDLRNPLTVVRGYAELLLRRLRRTDPPNRERMIEGLARIERTATHTIGLLNELLDIARLEMGASFDLDAREVDLVELAERAARDNVPSRTAGPRLRLDRPPAGSLIGTWDAARTERVLANLLTNAVKFSPDGGEIRVKVEQRGPDEAGRHWAAVSVRDEGVGIPAEELPRIFDRLYRASNVDGLIAGAGIGLASSKSIAELQGGRIDVESSRGAGSTFTLLLPLEHAEPERKNSPAGPV